MALRDKDIQGYFSYVPLTNAQPNVTSVNRGMNTDVNPINQPKGTYRRAINGVVRNDEGDTGFISNEESNKEAYADIEGIIIGECYMNEGSHVIFHVGIGDDGKKTSYITLIEGGIAQRHVAASALNFDPRYPIQSVYRLRRGSQRVVYFTDDYNPPRYYIFDEPAKFQTKVGSVMEWDPNKFRLIQSVRAEDLPELKGIRVNEGGSLRPGSYNFALQYVDDNFNPTEFVMSTDPVMIYHSELTDEWTDINGSIDVPGSQYLNFGATNKSITLSFNSLSQRYGFYRVAIVCANNGNGQINKVYLSDYLSTKNTDYTYTGGNAKESAITLEDISRSGVVIGKCKTIEQLDNRLVLGNVSAQKYDFFSLQKYASRIKSNLKVSKRYTYLNNEKSVDEPDLVQRRLGQKNPYLTNAGYMPGEIYAFGIIYVFKDGTESPVYHIPGKSKKDVSSLMDSDNECETTLYIDPSRDTILPNLDEEYWGLDYMGDNLKDQKVRHHRFPKRDKDKKLVVTDDDPDKKRIYSEYFEIEFDNIDNPDPDNIYGYFIVRAERKEDDKTVLDTGLGLPVLSYNGTSPDGVRQGNKYASFGNMIPYVQTDDGDAVAGNRARNRVLKNTIAILNPECLFRSRMYGNFTSLDLNRQNYGYFRNSLDSYRLDAVTKVEDIQAGTSYDADRDAGKADPDGWDMRIVIRNYKFSFSNSTFLFFGNNIEFKDLKDVSFLSPLTSVNVDEYPIYNLSNENRIMLVTADDKGDIIPGYRKTDSVVYSDYDANIVKDQYNKRTYYYDYNRDVVNCQNIFSFEGYGNAYDSQYVKYGGGIINPSSSSFARGTGAGTIRPLYVVINRKLREPYSDFRTRAYYKEHTNIKKFDAKKTNVDHGDSYIFPMDVTSTVFVSQKIGARPSKSQFWTYFLGITAIVAGVVGSIFTFGASLGLTALGIATLGVSAGALALGISQVSSGIKYENSVRIYQQKYKDGLKDTFRDEGLHERSSALDLYGFSHGVCNGFKSEDDMSDVIDDELQYLSTTLSNSWFESSFNGNLRCGNTLGLTSYLTNYWKDLPSLIWEKTGEGDDGGKYDIMKFTILSEWKKLISYYVNKLTFLDANKKNGRHATGIASPELYQFNEDYARINREKPYYHLPLTYKKNDTEENFPHRIIYSEQSYQEEVVDNYRVFLANNYTDIEGKSGEITGLFTMRNNLFVLTTECLWHLPQAYQERVTGDIVSFLGTGSYFSIPPRIIVDTDNGNSGGCVHTQSICKTPYGVFYASEKNNKIYMFNGSYLRAISSNGMFSFFNENSKIHFDEQYKKLTRQGNVYPLRDTLGSPYSTGFIISYDAINNRLLATKRDFKVKEELVSSGFLNDVDFDSLFNDVLTNKKELKDIDGYLQSESYTISYSFDFNSFISFHSYIPSVYISNNNTFYSVVCDMDTSSIWKHNERGSYLEYYGKRRSMIIDYVSLLNPITTAQLDNILLQTEAKEWYPDDEKFIPSDYTFNYGVIYNNSQNSGFMSLFKKDPSVRISDNDFIDAKKQDGYKLPVILGDVNGDYIIDKIRALDLTFSKPMFKKNESNIFSDDTLLGHVIYDDSIVNIDDIVYQVFDPFKSALFKGKFVIVRLIFGNFDGFYYNDEDKLRKTKLTFNYSLEKQIIP